jgi:hypothetical protein
MDSSSISTPPLCFPSPSLYDIIVFQHQHPSFSLPCNSCTHVLIQCLLQQCTIHINSTTPCMLIRHQPISLIDTPSPLYQCTVLVPCVHPTTARTKQPHSHSLSLLLHSIQPDFLLQKENVVYKLKLEVTSTNKLVVSVLAPNNQRSHHARVNGNNYAWHPLGCCTFHSVQTTHSFFVVQWDASSIQTVLA